MMKKISVAVVFMTIQTFLFCQNYIGYSENNYAGVHAGYANPAYMADNRLLVDVNIASVSLTGFNDYLYYNPRNMPFGYVKTYLSSNPSAVAYREDPFNDTLIAFEDIDYVRNTLGTGNLFEYPLTKDNTRNLFYNHEAAVFNFMVSLDDDVAFSFGIKQRSFINVDRVSNELILLSKSKLELPELWGKDLISQDIKVSYSTWNEYALGLASVVYNQDAHFVKTGLNLKYLQGISAVYFSTDDLSYNLQNGDTATFISGNIEYGYSSNLESSSIIDDSLTLDDFGINFSNPFAGGDGNGFAADLGVVYEWRPKYKDFLYEMDGKKDLVRADQNKYKLRVALSFNDLGGVRYKRDENGREFRINDLTNFDLSRLRADSTLEEFNQNVNDLEALGEVSYTNTRNSFFINSPAHIIANVDYMVAKNFYVNANGLLGLRMRNNTSNSSYHSSVSLTPRYEHPYFAAAIPLSYSKAYGTRIGFSVRISPYFVLGTSNLVPFFSAGTDAKVNGADFYVAIKVPILKKIPKDRDGDLVSDKEDLCVQTPGVWQFKGCPDSDGDGVQDSEDRCPTEPGKIKFHGCPDRDDDQIIDLRDDCPDVPGLVEFNGCPDTDGDKIMDQNDDCPEVAGITEFNGCPDTDGDGIKDSEDLCPEAAGPKANNGCPDSDNDGLFDYLDDCPTVSGPSENKGCPWPDTDEDGILDKDDKCPYK